VPSWSKSALERLVFEAGVEVTKRILNVAEAVIATPLKLTVADEIVAPAVNALVSNNTMLLSNRKPVPSRSAATRKVGAPSLEAVPVAAATTAAHPTAISWSFLTYPFVDVVPGATSG